MTIHEQFINRNEQFINMNEKENSHKHCFDIIKISSKQKQPSQEHIYKCSIKTIMKL